MSELRDAMWAVLSARGYEGGGLTYDEARTLLNELMAEDVNGLVVTTQAAARRSLQTGYQPQFENA